MYAIKAPKNVPEITCVKLWHNFLIRAHPIPINKIIFGSISNLL